MFTSKSNNITIKRDSYENWQKATKYIPSVNTIIIVDMPNNSIQLKIGDGKTLVADLQNILSPNYIGGPLSTASVDEGVLSL